MKPASTIAYFSATPQWCLSFLLIYFGVRSYRDNVGKGTVGFGRALAVGSSIGLVASLCYVASWEVMYFKFMPDS
jgi:hypothetical protein